MQRPSLSQFDMETEASELVDMYMKQMKYINWYFQYQYVLSYRCVRVTDVGVIAIAESCTSLEYLR